MGRTREEGKRRRDGTYVTGARDTERERERRLLHLICTSLLPTV